MNFYEVKNGYIGESYVRVYVWAKDEQQAYGLAVNAFKNECNKMPKKHRYKKDYWANLKAKFLFGSSSKQFATIPSDCGVVLERL